MFSAEELCSEEPCRVLELPLLLLLPFPLEFTAAAAAAAAAVAEVSESAEGDRPLVRLIFARRFLNQN